LTAVGDHDPVWPEHGDLTRIDSPQRQLAAVKAKLDGEIDRLDRFRLPIDYMQKSVTV
jgi:hypothetical protein